MNNNFTFFNIAPVAHLDLMEESSNGQIFGLAHLWLQYPHYKEFLLQKKKEGRFILLDNSACEGSLVTEDILIDIVGELEPSDVISPDILFNKEETLKNLDSFAERMQKEGLLKKTKLFLAVQGENKEAWIEGYQYGIEHEAVSILGWSKLGVPFAINGMTNNDQGIMEARHMMYFELRERNLLGKSNHMLGAGNYQEFKHYTHPAMRSNDSCYAILAAINGVNFQEGNFTRIPTPHDYFEYTMNAEQITLAKSNMKWVQESVKS